MSHVSILPSLPNANHPSVPLPWWHKAAKRVKQPTSLSSPHLEYRAHQAHFVPFIHCCFHSFFVPQTHTHTHIFHTITLSIPLTLWVVYPLMSMPKKKELSYIPLDLGSGRVAQKCDNSGFFRLRVVENQERSYLSLRRWPCIPTFLPFVVPPLFGWKSPRRSPRRPKAPP